MKNILLFLACAVLAGCASYQDMPLATRPHFAATVEALATVPPGRSGVTSIAHHYDFAAGLDMTELATLAVINNPDLKLARDDAGIAHAQAFSAGLLPDPQLALSRDLSNSGGPGSTTAFSIGLSYDLNALLQRSNTQSAADADAQKTDLNLLWQEWQVVSGARILFVKLTEAKELARVLEQNRALYAERLAGSRMALEKGLVTSDAVTQNLVALQDVQRQINDLERQTNQNTHDLNALLGLAPGANVKLHADDQLSVIDDKAIDALLPDLPKRRPDLLALEAGYRAEDQRYRAALLGQFPALNIGLTRARDNTDTYSNAIGITLSLPIFNRNRGNIAVEQATRQRLHDEYQQRLNTSVSDLHRLLDEQHINLRQLSAIDGDLALLSHTIAQAEQAYLAHNIDAVSYANVRSVYLAKRIERINLHQSVLEQHVAVQALLGGELPVIKNNPDDKP
ncbi:MAG TPA: TolC family protein [Burkholderiaceae bacterium]